MRYLVILLCFLSPLTLSDDALINPVAKKIKTSVLKGLSKSHIEVEGYCDLMIEMKHAKGYARIKRSEPLGIAKSVKKLKSICLSVKVQVQLS